MSVLYDLPNSTPKKNHYFYHNYLLLMEPNTNYMNLLHKSIKISLLLTNKKSSILCSIEAHNRYDKNFTCKRYENNYENQLSPWSNTNSSQINTVSTTTFVLYPVSMTRMVLAIPLGR